MNQEVKEAAMQTCTVRVVARGIGERKCSWDFEEKSLFYLD